MAWETNPDGTYYDNDASMQTSINVPGAHEVRFHFDRFYTEAGYDELKVYDKVGRRVATYSGYQGSGRTEAFDGDRFTLKFDSDYSVRAEGISLRAVEHLTPEPRYCTMQYDPVCGADGDTYSNSCFAGAAGVEVTHLGACGTAEGDFCGGLFDRPCSDGLTCELDSDAADASGACRYEADPCVCYEIYAPVCGADGQTYSNDCFAGCADTAIAYEGECQ